MCTPLLKGKRHFEPQSALFLRLFAWLGVEIAKKDPHGKLVSAGEGSLPGVFVAGASAPHLLLLHVY